MSMDEHDVYQPPCPGCGYGVNTNDSERCRWADEAYWHRDCLISQKAERPTAVNDEALSDNEVGLSTPSPLVEANKIEEEA